MVIKGREAIELVFCWKVEGVRKSCIEGEGIHGNKSRGNVGDKNR